MLLHSYCTAFTLLISALVPGTVQSHGYTTISRGMLCKDGRNFDCGGIIFEIQSVEGPKGFPTGGPVDGEIASAGLGRFASLNQQTAFRWLKTNVQEGPLDFTWLFNVNHSTTSFEYFITQDNWNPEAPLTRAQFDLVPFCVVPFGGMRPASTGETHTCNLPNKSGYHVILAVWTIDDTGAAFYNVNDVQFDGTNAPISPSVPPTRAPVAPTTSPAPTPAPGAVCSSGLSLEAVDDCTAFVFCDNRVVIPGSTTPCTTGLLFDNTRQVCDWPNTVDCVLTTATPVPPPTPQATHAPGGSAALCSSGEILESNSDCSGFVYCQDGAVVPNSEVLCAPGLLFNPTTLVCDYEINVDCN